MSIRIGDIDLLENTLTNEMRIAILEKLVERILNRVGPHVIGEININQIRNDVICDLQKKYPNTGIQFKQT